MTPSRRRRHRQAVTAAVIAGISLCSEVSLAAITGTGQVTPAVGASPWTASGIIVGNNSAGTLTVNAGSDIIANVVPSTTEPAIALGYTATGSGTLSLTGSGSTVSANGGFAAGYRGAGQLSVTSSAILNTTGNDGNLWIAGFVVNNGVANSSLVVNSGGRVNTSRIVAVNIPNPSPNLTTYQLDISSGGVVHVGTNFQINGSSNVGTGYGRARVTGAGSRLEATFGAQLGYNGQLDFEVSGGGAITSGSALEIGYQGETQFRASNATISASTFSAAGGSGFANIELGAGTNFTVANDSQFGNGGRTMTQVHAGAKFDSTGAITIGGNNSVGSVVSVEDAATIFRSNNRLNVGGFNTTRRGVLGLSGATAEGRTGVFVDRGGLVTGSGGTLYAPNGTITIDGIAQTIPNLVGGTTDTALHLKPSNSSAFSNLGTLQPQYNILTGTLRIGKLVVDSGQLTLNGTLDLDRQLNSALPTTATMYTPQTIVDATTGSASYAGKFTSFPEFKIDANTAWVISYLSRAVTIQRAKLGDADLDNQVNFDDLIILAQNYNQTGKTWAQADFNYDGRVNFDDLIPLAQHYQGTAATVGLPSAFAADWTLAQSLVPEPALLASAVGAVAVTSMRRQKR